MRPGKPLMFGRVHDVPLLGVPGNPVSAGVCAVLFVRAAICVLLGLDPAPPEVPAVLGAPLRANDRRQDYLRARSSGRTTVGFRWSPAPRQDSSMLATFARADCLIKRPPFAPAIGPGTVVSGAAAGFGTGRNLTRARAKKTSCFSTAHKPWNALADPLGSVFRL